jgi:hypothetical protein
MPQVGDIRWNAAKGFYQGYAVVPTPLGFPLPAWVKVPNQEQARAAMAEGYKNLETYKKAMRSGAAGAPAPHTLGGPTPSAMVAGMEVSGMDLCKCAPPEHEYEAPIQETGLRPLYRSQVTLAAGAAGQLVIEANDGGAVNRLALFASDIVNATGQERGVTIPGAILLNSKPFDFGTVPNGTLTPWATFDNDGIGRDIGRLELVKTDQFTIPLLNNTAVQVVVEGFAYLRGNCPSRYLRK